MQGYNRRKWVVMYLILSIFSLDDRDYGIIMIYCISLCGLFNIYLLGRTKFVGISTISGIGRQRLVDHNNLGSKI